MFVMNIQSKHYERQSLMCKLAARVTHLAQCFCLFYDRSLSSFQGVLTITPPLGTRLGPFYMFNNSTSAKETNMVVWHIAVFLKFFSNKRRPGRVQDNVKKDSEK